MKKNTIIILCLLSFSNILFAKTTIYGKVETLKNSRLTLSIAEDPILGYKNIQSVFSNTKGEFLFEFELKSPKPIYLRYSDSSVLNDPSRIYKIWIEPETNSKLIINKDRIIVFGPNQKANNYLFDFQFALNEYNVKYNFNFFDFDGVSSYVDSIYYNKLNKYKKHVYKSNLSIEFKNYLKSEIKVEQQRNKFRYMIEYSFEKKLSVKEINKPLSFYNFIDTIDILSDVAFISLSYRNFLFEYLDYLSFENLNVNENYLLKVYRILDLKFSNQYETKKFLKIKFYNMAIGSVTNLDTLEAVYNNINKEILNESYKNAINLKYKHTKSKIINLVKMPDVYVIDTTGNKVLLNNYLGKLTLIDFWGTWCKPCMEGMAFQKYLEQKYQNENLTFIYLNNQDPVDLWKKSINKIKVSGLHFKLDNISEKLLMDYFVFNTYPFYALLDENQIQITKYGLIIPKLNSEEIIDMKLGIK